MFNRKKLLLSYSVSAETPVYGAAPVPQIIPTKSLAKGDSCNTYQIQMSNHCGTHVDAPAHFVQGGRKIADYSLQELVFHNVALVHLEKKPSEIIMREDVETLCARFSQDIDCVLLRTGFSKYRGKDEYSLYNPGIHPDAIEWLRKNFLSLRCIGIDVVSISSYQNRELGRVAHRMALEEKGSAYAQPLLLIEDLNLDALSSQEKYQLEVYPWFCGEIDSSPCIVVACSH